MLRTLVIAASVIPFLCCRLDGLDLESDAKFTGKAHRALAEAHFEYAEGFDLAEWQKVCNKLAALRERLRQIKV